MCCRLHSSKTSSPHGDGLRVRIGWWEVVMFPWVKSQKWEKPMYTSICCDVPWVKSQKWEKPMYISIRDHYYSPTYYSPQRTAHHTNTPQHIGLLYLVFLQSSTTYISAPYIIQPIFSISSLSLFFCVTRECQHLIFGIPRVVFC